MNGAIIILMFVGLIGWLNYLRNQQKTSFLQSKDSYIRDILSRYPTADGLEKLLKSEEWQKLMELYGKPVSTDNRLIVLFLVGLGILVLCMSVAATVITVFVDDELIYAAAFLGAIGVGLLSGAALFNHYLKKWKL